MDQVKIYLALLVKYHFWVLSLMALIIGLTGWTLATGSLAAYYQTQRAKIEGEFTKLHNISAVQHHPNKSFEEGVDKLLNDRGIGLKSRVLAAWTQVYEQQKNVVLQWPTKKDELGEDFQVAVQDKGPTDEVDIQFRERYQNYVKAEFPRLLKMVRAQPYQDVKKERKPGEEKSEPFIVDWKVDNQRSIDDSLDWPRVPTTKEMFYVQEDLWVYHALLKIIDNVNATANGHYNARIKEISEIEIARYAGKQFQAGMASGKLFVPQVHTGAPGTAPTPPPNRDQGPANVGGGGANAALAAVQEDGRYVDAKGQPLAAGAAAPPEFKRMPVYLQLIMDQREVAALLAECANSPLPIEVRMVRVNPTHLRGKGRGTASPSVFAGAKGGPSEAGAAEQDLNPYDLPVEVYGIIYIYNRPDRAKLNVIGQGPEPADGEPAAEGEKPAAETEPAPEKAVPAKEPAEGQNPSPNAPAAVNGTAPDGVGATKPAAPEETPR